VSQSTKRTLTTGKVFASGAYVLLGALMILNHRHNSPDMARDILMGVAFVVLGLVWFWKRERLLSENRKSPPPPIAPAS
jgi:hypothetical protein